MGKDKMKQAVDIALPGATLITMVSDATAILQFVVALLTAVWLIYRFYKAWRNDKPAMCVTCPHAPRDEP